MTNHLTGARFAERLLPSIRRAGANDPDQHDGEFNQLAQDLFAIQFAGVAGYRRFCENRGVRPGSISHWTQIPAVSTQAFKELEITSIAPAERSRVFYSSGTTGPERSRHYHSTESLRVYEASLLEWFRRHLLPEMRMESRLDLQFIALAPPPNVVPNSSLVYMFATIRNAFPFASSEFFGQVDPDGGWSLDLPELTRALDAAQETGNPLLLLGTAFSLVHLTDHLEAAGLRFALPRGSRVMETGGYKGRSRVVPKSELESALLEKLGLPEGAVVSEYGMSELSSQAYNRCVSFETGRDDSLSLPVFRFPPWARARVISPETGEEVGDGKAGLLQVMDLANIYSVAALQTEDLAVRTGSGFVLAGRASRSEPRGCSLMFQ